MLACNGEAMLKDVRWDTAALTTTIATSAVCVLVWKRERGSTKRWPSRSCAWESDDRDIVWHKAYLHTRVLVRWGASFVYGPKFWSPPQHAMFDLGRLLCPDWWSRHPFFGDFILPTLGVHKMQNRNLKPAQGVRHHSSKSTLLPLDRVDIRQLSHSHRTAWKLSKPVHSKVTSSIVVPRAHMQLAPPPFRSTKSPPPSYGPLASQSLFFKCISLTANPSQNEFERSAITGSTAMFCCCWSCTNQITSLLRRRCQSTRRNVDVESSGLPKPIGQLAWRKKEKGSRQKSIKRAAPADTCKRGLKPFGRLTSDSRRLGRQWGSKGGKNPLSFAECLVWHDGDSWRAVVLDGEGLLF